MSDVDDLVTWLLTIWDKDGRDVQESRALIPNDLHWSMPNWLDRDFMLAEIKAKRRILDYEVKRLRRLWARSSDEHHQTFEAWCADWRYSTIVRLLALPYRDRPGYREEWAP